MTKELVFRKLLLLVLTLGIFSCSSGNAIKKPSINEEKNANITLEGAHNNSLLASGWGVEIQQVGLSAANYMLDFRYKVTDVEKAKTILKRSIKPYLLVEKNGVKLPVPSTPKLGSIRQHTKTPELGRIYFVFFKNVSKMVKKGDKVTVVIGDFRAENIIVI